MSGEPVISVRGLRQGYPNGPEVLAGVDLDVAQGELVLLVGPSGCGKSTLAACIKGIIPHLLDSDFQGEVEVAGIDVREAEPAQLAATVGMVFQDPESQLCNLYIEDEIAFGPENLRLPAEGVRRAVAQMAGQFGLPRDMATRLVYELSGGQKQRLVTASVLAMDPDVLIFDEPTANLDPQGGRDVADSIRLLRARGATQLVIEHKIEDLIDVADRVVVMERGKIVADAAPRELFARHGLEFCRRYGIWTPQIPEMAMRLDPPVSWSPLPLTVDEAADQLGVHLADAAPVAAEAESAGAPRGAGAAPIVRVSDLHFAYANKLQALRGVTFEIFPGESVAIVGTNGSGKTTLAKTLVSLLKPRQGSVTVCGMDVRKTPTRDITREVGYVFQYPEHQFVTEKVVDEVAYGLRVQGHPEELIGAKVDAILERFGLTEFADNHPVALSGGQKRRLSVATMLVLDPSILILDEPTFGQDQDNTRRMMQYLLEDMRQGRDDALTTIMITHDMELVTQLCDRVLVMSAGELIFAGTPRELIGEAAVMRAGDLSDVPINRLAAALRARGVETPAGVLTVDEFVHWFRQACARPTPVRSD
jgi:energy-coupling factor transport system ATP-binding protein